MVGSADIIVGRQWFFNDQLYLFIHTGLQHVLNLGVSDAHTGQRQLTRGFQPGGTVPFLQHQHPKTGFVILLYINAGAKYFLGHFTAAWPYPGCFRQQFFLCPAIHGSGLLVVLGHVIVNGSISFASYRAGMYGNTLVIIIHLYRLLIIPHFYFLAYKLPGYTLVQIIFPELYVVVALYGQQPAFLQQTGC